MTKQELEQLVERLQRENTELKKNLNEQQQAFFKQTEEIEAAFEEKRYQDWKAANGKFAERFVRELIEQNLSVEIDTGYDGEVKTTLTYCNKVISRSYDTVMMHGNSLDE